MALPLAAVVAVLCGLLWKAPVVGALDARAAIAVNRMRVPHVLDLAVIAARPLGTKWAWLATLAGMILADWRRGLWLVPMALSAAALERGAKALARRPRPFQSLPSILLRQSAGPVDTGFPSGDAMRAWFVVSGLARGLPVAPAWVVMLAVGATLLVSYGRVRMGAHYPLDVWAGGWIGIGFAAGAAVLAT